MEIWKIILIPVVGFIIGYFTNYLAVLMLFRPRKKVFGFRGVLPSRKRALAKNIAEVSLEVLPESVRDIGKVPFIGEKIISSLKKSIEKRINSLSDEEIEEIVLKVIKKELRFITWVGGLLGFLIGLVQVGILFI